MSVLRDRGPRMYGERHGYLTVHPSYLLRIPDAQARHEAQAAFIADLVAMKQLGASFG